MIKLISFVVFVAAFIWTWFLFNSEPKIHIAVHAGLQSKLSLLIEETIKTAKPNSNRFQMLSIQTKTLEDNKVAAYFSYRYNENLADKESSLQTIKGEAILNRTVSENPEEEKWVVQSVKTDSSAVEFQEGLVIGPNTPVPAETATASGDSTNATPTPEPKKTE